MKVEKKKSRKGSDSGSSSEGAADEMDRMEQERLEDLKERDEFSQRLKDKDKEKTRSIVTKSGMEEIKFWLHS